MRYVNSSRAARPNKCNRKDASRLSRLSIITTQMETPMTVRKESQRVVAIKRALAVASALSFVTMIAALATVTLPTKADAKPEFAAQTGYPCGQCHINPAGSGDLKAYGKKFKANGFKK